MFKIAVFVSGRGSNLKAIFNGLSGSDAKICAVISDKNECGAVVFATGNEIPVYVVDKNSAGSFTYIDIAEELKKIEIDLIVLAGFLKKIPDEFVDEFENKIINIHPALLPAFGGKGMYGSNVHKAVFESSAKISGATVHFVDKIYDHGKIIAQRTVDISDVTCPEDIAERVLKIEHEILPYVVLKFVQKKILVENNRVKIL